MASIALPRHQAMPSPDYVYRMGSTLHQRSTSLSSPVELVPNPHFVFPMRAEDPPRLESPAAMNPSSRPVSLPPARRGVGAGSGQRRSASALPAFSFNPSGTSNTSTHTVTPPDSPLPPTMPVTPSRGVGHRRGGSEFIGGDGKAGGAGLRSSSPTKGEGVLPAPTSEVKFGPPASRRGHAHRRSGAVSCHDLSNILQPKDANTMRQAGSAPVTPLKDDVKTSLPTNMDQAPAHHLCDVTRLRTPDCSAATRTHRRHGDLPHAHESGSQIA